MSVSIVELRQIFEDRKSRQDLLLSQKQNKIEKIKDLLQEVETVVQARWVIVEVSRLTQEKLTGYVESMVTMAIQSVYSRPFRFLTKFEINRNKSECQMVVYEGEEKSREEMFAESFQPENEEGGGLLDVISFALRVVLWSLQKPKSRNVLLLDEPMKFLGELSIRAGELFKEVSHRLGIQLILNTHDIELSGIADKSWIVTHNGVESLVQEQGVIIKPTIQSRRRRVE